MVHLKMLVRDKDVKHGLTQQHTPNCNLPS